MQRLTVSSKDDAHSMPFCLLELLFLSFDYLNKQVTDTAFEGCLLAKSVLLV